MRRRSQKPKRQASPKRQPPATTPSALFGAPVGPPPRLQSADSEFVAKLAAAIVQVNQAQARLLEEVETASSTPSVLQDPGWQAQSEVAAEQLSAAGAQLRIQPLPESMQAVDELLAKAQREGQVASQTHVTSVAAGNLPAMVGTLQHLDRMAQLIEQAYQLIRR